MKTKLRLHSLCSNLVAMGFWVQVFAGSLSSNEPNSAQECMDRYVNNSQKLEANRACCAECELTTSHGETAMDFGYRWVFLGVSERARKREYVEATSLHNIGIPAGYWERSLTVGDDYFYDLGPRTKPLVPSKEVEVRNNEERIDLFRIRKRRLVFRVPHPVVLTILPNSLFLMRDDTHANLVHYVHRVLKPVDDKKMDTGFLGTWQSPAVGLEIFFAKHANYMPTIVRGYFLDKQKESMPITTKNFGELQYEIRNKWENVALGKDQVFAPTHVLNTMHKLNRKDGRSRELEIHAAWRFAVLDPEWLSAESLNAEIASPGAVSRLKEELVAKLEDRIK
jgi:hypothetical protein